jgi:hypothetical protein
MFKTALKFAVLIFLVVFEFAYAHNFANDGTKGVIDHGMSNRMGYNNAVYFSSYIALASVACYSLQQAAMYAKDMCDKTRWTKLKAHDAIRTRFEGAKHFWLCDSKGDEGRCSNTLLMMCWRAIACAFVVLNFILFFWIVSESDDSFNDNYGYTNGSNLKIVSSLNNTTLALLSLQWLVGGMSEEVQNKNDNGTQFENMRLNPDDSDPGRRKSAPASLFSFGKQKFTAKRNRVMYEL